MDEPRTTPNHTKPHWSNTCVRVLLLASRFIGVNPRWVAAKVLEMDAGNVTRALQNAIETKDAKAILAALGKFTLEEIGLDSLSGDALIAMLEDSTIPEKERLQCMKDFIYEKGAKPNFTGETNTSPLHIAALQGNVEAIHLLIKAGTLRNLQDDNGITPLFGAAWNGNPEVLRLLLVADADPKMTDHSGSTPLHVASLKGNADAVKQLIDVGANIHAIASVLSESDTPLHLAAASGNANIVKLLIQAGADIRAQDSNNNTALQIAMGKNNPQCIVLLQEAEAQHKTKPDTAAP